jgi:tetratricopeptide (TPR) repeat protein
MIRVAAALAGEDSARMSRAARAGPAFGLAEQLDRSNRSAQRGLGWVALLTDEPDDAAAAWTRAGWTSLDLWQWAQMETFAGHDERALALLVVAEQLDDELDSGVAYWRHVILTARDRREEAALHLRAAVERDTGWLDREQEHLAWSSYADQLFAARRFDESEQAAARAVSVCQETDDSPGGCWRSYHRLALAQMRQGKSVEAARTLETALSAHASEPWLWVRYGQALYLTGPLNASRMEEAFCVAVELGNQQSIWEAIVRFCREQGLDAQAGAWCAKARVAGFSDLPSVACPDLGGE